MKNNPTLFPLEPTADQGPVHDAATVSAPAQLTLIPAPKLPARFLIPERTKRSGLRHIAELRAEMEARRLATEGQSPAA